MGRGAQGDPETHQEISEGLSSNLVAFHSRSGRRRELVVMKIYRCDIPRVGERRGGGVLDSEVLIRVMMRGRYLHVVVCSTDWNLL